MAAGATGLSWWERLSLRNQLTVVNMVLLALSLIIAGTGTTILLRPTLIGQLDANLRSVAVDPNIILGGNAETGDFTFNDIRTAPQPYYVAAVDSFGRIIADNWALHPRALAPDLNSLVLQYRSNSGYSIYEMHDGTGATMRAIVVLDGQYQASQVYGTMVIAMPLSDVNSTMAAFLAIFFGFGLSVLIFAAVLTRMLVSTTLKPLRRVESTAMNFAAGDYDQRLPESTPNTEVGRLSRSLNSMLGQIDSALDERDRTIQQMRRFVGDASHELRTPLVTVRGYAELYRMGALDAPEKVGQAMDRIEGEAKRMGGLVEDLLQLARLDENREMSKDVLDLEPLVEDAAMDTRAQAPNRVVSVRPPLILTSSAPASGASGDPTILGQQPGSAQPSVPQPWESAAPGMPASGAPMPGVPAPGVPAPGVPATKTAPAKSGSGRAGSVSNRPRVPGIRRLRRRGATDAAPELAAAAAGAPEPMVYADEDVPAMIFGNSDKVRQAISNIIGNALRYTPAGSPLELGTIVNVSERTATVAIIDHGEGIPEESRKHIFQRFWRADTSRARETGGTGLGLAIVSAIMQAHDGTVDVVETPGGGATFRLSFPLLLAPPVDEHSSTDS